MSGIERVVKQERHEPWYAFSDIALEKGLTGDEVAKATGLDFTVEHVGPLTVMHEGRQLLVPDRRAVVRTDTHEVLGDVGKTHALYQHGSMLEFGEAVLGEGNAEWVAAGPLRQGKQAFAALQLPETVSILGDDMAIFVLLLNSLDGSLSLTGMTLAERLSCTNQLAATYARTTNRFKVRHVGDVSTRVAQARHALGVSSQYIEDFKATAERMASIDVELAEADAILAELIPSAKSEARQRQVEELRTAVRSNWLHSETIADDWRKSRWGLYNAITEHYEHQRGLRADRRANVRERQMLANLDGPIGQMRERAFARLAGR